MATLSTPSSSSSIFKFCADTCSGHLNPIGGASFPSTQAEFFAVISGRTGFLFEHLQACALQLRHAQLEDSLKDRCFKFRNGFCVKVNELVLLIISGIEDPGVNLGSVESRLARLYIARLVRDYIRTFSFLKKICPDEFDSAKSVLNKAEAVYLTFAPIDRELGSLRKAGFIIPESDTSPVTISESRARDLVERVYTGKIVEQCKKVDALVTVSDGVLSLVGSYVPDPIDDLLELLQLQVFAVSE